MRIRNLTAGIAAIVALCLLSSLVWAQTASLPASSGKNGAVAQPPPVTDPLGRTTPQGSIVGFMMSAQRRDNARAIQYLDTKKTGRSAQRLIDELQVLLERGFSGKLGMLSNKPEGRLDDSLPPSKELVGTIKSEVGSLDVLMERVKRGNEPPIWLFASETLSRVPEFYEEQSDRPFDKYVPRFLKHRWFLWFALWQWIYILLVIPLSFMVATLLTRLITPLLIAVAFKVTRIRADHHLMTLKGPIRIFFLALAIWSLSFISRSILVNLFWYYAALTLTVMGTTWFAVRVIHMIVKLKHSQWAGIPSGRVAMIQLVGKLAKALTVITGFLVILYIAGFNITAALTGLGIGGIAIAFAAQKTLENLFGGIMIISDQPIRVGDFCKAGAFSGTIESIGLRSTYIRTPERTIVSIPNGQLATMSLENYAFRDKMLLHHFINLHPEATSLQVTTILDGARSLLAGNAKIEASTARVNLVRFSDSAVVLELYAYVEETAYEQFTMIQEGILVSVMEVVSRAGARLAVPAGSQSQAVTAEAPKA